MKYLTILALAVLAAVVVLAEETWVCPMPEHSKVFSAAGLCPACGMELISKTKLDAQKKLAAQANAGRGPGADLKPPAKGKIRVAFPISRGATMIDFAGPWEVFQDVTLPGRGVTPDDTVPFELYTVAATRDPIRATGGMTITPDFTFDDAPVPNIIIVPAQSGSHELHAWLKKMYPKVEVLASVCTGAFHLAHAGLLDGKEATTHHDFYTSLSGAHPEVKVVRGRRYVQSDAIVATAGGLSSGIDLALHIVERYFGRDIAAQTAEYMEYSSDAWRSGKLASK